MTRFIPLAVVLGTGIAMTAFAAPQNDAAHPNPAPAANAQGQPSPVKPGDRNCLRDTGSLIPPKKGDCLPVTGRSYSKDDIDNTGAHTLGPALQRLDPSITLQH
jgi:putative hemolysin